MSEARGEVAATRTTPGPTPAHARGAEELRSLLTELLETQCRLLEASAGVIYLAGSPTRRAGVFARWPARTNLLDDAALARLERLGEQTLSSPNARIESITIADKSPLYDAGRTHLVLIAPLRAGDRVEGVAMLVMPAQHEVDAERALTQLALCSAPFEAFLWRQQAMTEARQKALLRQTLELIDVALEGESARGMASIMATELGRRFGCTRVSIGLIEGSGDRIGLVAVSGAEDLDRKGPAAEALIDAMEECALQDIELVYPPLASEDTPPGAKRVLRAHERLSQAFGPSAILSLPLRVEGDLVGVVLLEREASDPFPPAAVPLLRLVAQFIGPALYTRRLADRGILAVARDRLRDLGTWAVGPRHTLAKVIALLAMGAVIASAIVPIPARVSADAELRAAVNRRVIPPFRAVLSEVLVRPGDRVEKGQLLARLDTQDLELERLRLEAERQELMTQRADAEMRGTPSDAARLARQIEQRDAQIALLEAQIARAQVRSPIAGTVSRGDLEDFVGATVDSTQALFEIVTDDLIVLIEVDERDIGRVEAGQRGWLVSKALPDERVAVEVVRINPVARPVEGANVYLVEARVRSDDGSRPAWLRPGMTGTVRLDAGTTTPMRAFLAPLVDELRFNLWW